MKMPPHWVSLIANSSQFVAILLNVQLQLAGKIKQQPLRFKELCGIWIVHLDSVYLKKAVIYQLFINYVMPCKGLCTTQLSRLSLNAYSTGLNQLPTHSDYGRHLFRTTQIRFGSGDITQVVSTQQGHIVLNLGQTCLLFSFSVLQSIQLMLESLSLFRYE